VRFPHHSMIRPAAGASGFLTLIQSGDLSIRTHVNVATTRPALSRRVLPLTVCDLTSSSARSFPG
jgi:hypothetical protein